MTMKRILFYALFLRPLTSYLRRYLRRLTNVQRL